MRNETWANWVRDRRKLKQFNRRELAKRVGIDPSYITLIESQGYVPRRHVVERLGKELGDLVAGMVVAGYVPPTRHRETMEKGWVDQLTRNSKKLLRQLANLPASRQDAFCTSIRSLAL